MRSFLTLALFVILISSCSKSSGDDAAPVIVINSPQANAAVPADAVITISASVNDEGEIHEVHLDITEDKTNQVFHYHYHPDVKTFSINETITAIAGTHYSIKVEADDHSGNKSEKEIEIHCD
ncbi:MAG TPA: Ig-like domain-containing protein [Flavitalea sp.]|nr:Ig-like domain-containing protein [Flavitalea sp.]